jgi:hypothetical protein
VLRNEIGLWLHDLLKTICAENEIEVVRGNVRANHIEDQDDTTDGFKVWDEEKHAETVSAAPAFRPTSKPSSLDEGR